MSDYNSGERQFITEEWLRSLDFKWDQLDRQSSKHWVLWLGRALRDYSEPKGRMFESPEEIGVDLAYGGVRDQIPWWYCWLRSDMAHRFSRFIHLRTLVYQDELVAVVEALTGYPWEPRNHIYGQVWVPEAADRLRAESGRLDKRIAAGSPWSEQEKDNTRGRPTQGHVKAAIDGGLAK